MNDNAFVDLFQPIVPESKMHESFKAVRSSIGHAGCRRLMNEIFNEMESPDNHFIEQFQTQGFDARVFELGIFAFLKECNLRVSQEYERPDFIVSNSVEEVCIEVTSSNPPDHLKLTNLATHFGELSQEQLFAKITDELPIRLGSPLFSKLKKNYWKLPQCQDKAMVLAIAAFHEPMASQYPVTSLCNYLYGTHSFPTWTKDGKLVINTEEIKKHQVEDKIIPSNFFGQPDTEHISAVLFSNQLTVSKFTRMAYQKGYNKENLRIFRSGMCHNPDPNAHLPLKFSYELGTPNAIEETWAQGLSLLLNSGANEPISPFYFNKVSTNIILDGELCSSVWDFHPFNSVTQVMVIGK